MPAWAGGCLNTPPDQGWGRGRQPVVNVSWDDITKDYLPWLSKVTGKTYRLLTEAEWEYAARAGLHAAYAWGNDLGQNRANCKGCGSEWDAKRTAPVGSFQANAFGLQDMHGNVWEWAGLLQEQLRGRAGGRPGGRRDQLHPRAAGEPGTALPMTCVLLAGLATARQPVEQPRLPSRLSNVNRFQGPGFRDQVRA